jgi:hypothetical protein
MEIPTNLREKLVREIRFVVDKIRAERELRTKVYYYSGVYGEMSRILNISFDPQLLFAHNTINTSYEMMRARSDTIVLGRDVTIDFPDGFFDRVCSLLEELASNIENNQNLYQTLQNISCLSYIITGNGYYLFQKGILRV